MYIVSVGYVIGVVFVMVISVLFLLCNKYKDLVCCLFVVVVVFGLLFLLLVVVLGDESGYVVSEY